MKIEFTGALPAIQSAVKIDGGGNGARIQMDVPETNKMEVFKVASLAGQTFKVTIEVEG